MRIAYGVDILRVSSAHSGVYFLLQIHFHDNDGMHRFSIRSGYIFVWILVIWFCSPLAVNEAALLVHALYPCFWFVVDLFTCRL